MGMLKSEWMKFRSTPLCIAGAVFTAFFSPLITQFSPTSNLQEAVSTLLYSFLWGQVGVVVFASGLFGREFEQSSFRTMLLAVPNRKKAVAVKAELLAGITLLLGVVSVFFSFIVLGIKLKVSIYCLLVENSLPFILVFSSWMLMGFMSATSALLLKSEVTPIAVFTSLILGLSQLLLAITKLAIYLPDLAGMNVFLYTCSAVYVSPLLGLGIQAVWVVVLGGSALYFVLHRGLK